MQCWDSLTSGDLGPLLLKSLGVWEWFIPKTFQGEHFLFSGELIWSICFWVIYPWNKFEEKEQCQFAIVLVTYLRETFTLHCAFAVSYVVLCRVGGDFTLTATCKEELRRRGLQRSAAFAGSRRRTDGRPYNNISWSGFGRYGFLFITHASQPLYSHGELEMRILFNIYLTVAIV